jgi:hypothetical protein
MPSYQCYFLKIDGGISIEESMWKPKQRQCCTPSGVSKPQAIPPQNCGAARAAWHPSQGQPPHTPETSN